MDKTHPDAPLLSLLEGRPLLRLTLLDHDYGTPCPEDRWEVKAAIDGLLKPSRLGMVLDVDVLEHDDGTCDDVLVIGVVDAAAALPKLCDLLKNLRVPAGATLVFDGSEENRLSGLLPRDEVVRESIEDMLQMLLAECRQCAPADWQAGTLTIQCDGSWLGYQLKNPRSPNAATISPRLKALCEELAVIMWNNGNRWREAVMDYEGKQFTMAFSHEEPPHPIPHPEPAEPPEPAAPPASPRSWWKLW